MILLLRQRISKDSVVTGVGHPNKPGWIYSHTRSQSDAICAIAEVSPCTYKFSGVCKFDHPVALGVCNENVVIWTDGNKRLVFQ